MLCMRMQVPILDSAVVAAATYAKRYFTDRKLPDKAVDLLDEAAARLCMQLEYVDVKCEQLIIQGKGKGERG